MTHHLYMFDALWISTITTCSRARDKDQVVARWAVDRYKKTHNILMVDQLWLWSFRREDGIDIVISSFPDRTGVRCVGSMETDKLRDRVLDPIGNTRNPIH